MTQTEASLELERYEEKAAKPAVRVGLFGTDDPAMVVERATEVARSLADVIDQRRLFSVISNRKYVVAEGWTLLASMLGVSVNVEWTRPLPDGEGWEARVVALRGDGHVLGSAEAMCTRSEQKWRTRDENALRSMAQTRATSKALRQPLGFVVQLAGYTPTPAEELGAEQAKPRAKKATKATITKLEKALKLVSYRDDLWSEEVVLANASRRFGRKVEKLTDLSEEEAKQITAGAEQYFLSYPPSQKEKETPHADDLQRLGMAIGALGEDGEVVDGDALDLDLDHEEPEED